MNLEEFAFMNQQLAAMLRDGIPLEGALRQLCADMERGALKSELQSLEADLARGASLPEALARRDLPNFYRRMVLVGIQSNDLPGQLTLLADYYQRQHSIWTRLKGLMIYPLIVLSAAFLLSCAISYLWGNVVWPGMNSVFGHVFEGAPLPAITRSAYVFAASLWAPPLILGGIVVFAFSAVLLPRLRVALCWRLPAFKDAALAQTASAMWMMLKSGVNLGDALALLERVENGTRAGADLTKWRARLTSGVGKFSAIAAQSEAFPPLFVWLAANGGEDLPTGFRRAAEVYQARSQQRTEAMLYAALPLAILALGVMILTQAYMALSAILPFLNLLGAVGGD